MSNIFGISESKQRLAIVDADSIIYYVGYASDMLDGDKRFALKLLDQQISSIYEGSDCAEMELYIGTDTNYRNEVATMKRYKSNRDGSKRPIYYNALRHRLVQDYDAHLCERQEAEDVVGIRSFEFDDFSDFVICRIDKDLAMLPGHHYNYRTGKSETISKHQALRNFYCQLVTGDSTDAIPGLYHQLLLDKEEELAKKFKHSRYKSKLVKSLKECYDEKSMWELVLNLYTENGQIEKHGLSRITEVGQLLWIRRDIGEMWVPLPERDFNYIDNDDRSFDDDSN